jgi:DNA repair protein RadC
VPAAVVVAAREFGATLLRPTLSAAGPAAALAAIPSGLELFGTEVLLGIALSGAHQVLGVALLAKGGTKRSCVSMADIFTPIVRAGAAAFVLAHNHPSGDPTPSPEDIRMTAEVARAGAILGIALVDHLIVAAQGTFSFFEQGLLPSGEEPFIAEFRMAPDGLGAPPLERRPRGTP